MDTLWKIVLAGLLSAIGWFVLGSVLYMNPLVARLYKEKENHPGLKKWESIPQYLLLQFLGILSMCLLFAIVYSIISIAITGSIWLKGFFFGLFLIAVRIYPRLFDMWIQSSYPDSLLIVEFINGAIGSILVGVILALIIR